MALYRINHTSVYRFDGAVSLFDCRVMLRPRDTAHQRCTACRVFTLPPSSNRDDTQDGFGNHVSRFTLRSPTSHFEIKAVSTVQARPDRTAWKAAMGHSWRDLRVGGDRSGQLGCEVDFLADSPLVAVTPHLRDYARGSFAADRPIREALCHFMARLRRDMRYAPQESNVDTTAQQALARRAGVCQDFAHVTIGCLRALGLPARYLGGYLVRENQGRRVAAGAEAAHAWCSLLVPDVGWVDFDPTHGRLCGPGYITVAWGRDYADVSPVQGATRGGRLTHSAVAIDIESTAEKQAVFGPAPPAAGAGSSFPDIGP